MSRDRLAFMQSELCKALPDSYLAHLASGVERLAGAGPPSHPHHKRCLASLEHRIGLIVYMLEGQLEQ